MSSARLPTESDAGVLALLGERLAARRLERNLTQAALAQQAGVSKRTLVRLESGESTQLANLVRVLRALGLLGELLSGLDALVTPPSERPLAQLRAKSRTRRRASRRKSGPSSHSTWTWGDESEGERP